MRTRSVRCMKSLFCVELAAMVHVSFSTWLHDDDQFLLRRSLRSGVARIRQAGDSRISTRRLLLPSVQSSCGQHRQVPDMQLADMELVRSRRGGGLRCLSVDHSTGVN